MNHVTNKLRRGDTSPQHPGLVFDRYKRGKETWITPQRLVKLREHLRKWQRGYPRSSKSRQYQSNYYRRPEVKARFSASNWTKEQREKRKAYTRSEKFKRRRHQHYHLNKEFLSAARIARARSRGILPRAKAMSSDEKRAKARQLWKIKMQDPQFVAHRRKIRKAWLNRKANELREYRQRRRQQTQFKLADNIRRRINWFLKHRGSVKSASTEQLFGCSFETLRLHLEAQFKDGMTWQNFGINGWHVDHKLPISMFDLRSDKMQKIAFNFQNLQPLWRKDNLAKSDKIEGELFRGRDLRKIVQFRAA